MRWIENGAQLRDGPMQLHERHPMQLQLLHQRLELLEDQQDSTDPLLLPDVGRIDRRV